MMSSNALLNRLPVSADPALEVPKIGPAGSLAETPSRWIVNHLHKEKFSGFLLLQYKDRRKKLWFHEGQIFKIQSNLIPELLGRMMVDRQWFNESDLKTCLDFQRDLIRNTHTNRPLGQLAQEIHGLDRDEVEALVEQQKVQSLFQALTWSIGTYEFVSTELKSAPTEHFDYGDLLQALKALIDSGAKSLSSTLESLDLWSPKDGSTELSRTPLWSILAGCRKRSLSGIVSVRRQNRLYELVLKHGIPLTYYEGSFGQPRQTIVVRRVSEDHEKFFVEQIFKLLSFLTGSVSFRMLEAEKVTQVEEELSDQFKEDYTAVTRSVHPSELLQVSSDKLKRYSALIMKELIRFAGNLKIWSQRFFLHFRRR
jgi:hypothetical protein